MVEEQNCEDLKRKIRELENKVANLQKTENRLREGNKDYGERVKELHCLYAIANLGQKRNISLQAILQGTVDLIPQAWQYPKITCARLTVEDQNFQTKNFQETPWKQIADIALDGEPIGMLEVYYLHQKPEEDEGPFLKEERNLLNVIVDRLGKLIGYHRALTALRDSEERYRVLAEHVADGVSLIQDGKLLFVNDGFAAMFGFAEPNQPFGKAAIALVSDAYKSQFKDLQEAIETGRTAKGTFCGRCISMDNREFWVEGHYNRINWKGKPALLGTIRDVTEAKLREIAMQNEADRLREENIKLRTSMKDRYRLGDIIGMSPVMQEIYGLILETAASDASVVIYGDSGTGKELVARTIKDLSKRSHKPFLAVNCGAIPETLFESEFFGYRKGAFTGAVTDKQGYFSLANGGTLFLDEVNELSPTMQSKLLRAIEGRGYLPIGDNRTRYADVRILAATSQKLTDQVSKGLMREDFFYRIHIISIQVPPLRDRKEDIPLLVDHFLRLYGREKKQSSIPAKVMDALCNYRWPGNVRELQNVLYRYVTLNILDFMKTDIPESKNGEGHSDEKPDMEDLNLLECTQNFQKNVILRGLERAQWHRGKAAELLNIDRKTLFRKMKTFGLT